MELRFFFCFDKAKVVWDVFRFVLDFLDTSTNTNTNRKTMADKFQGQKQKGGWEQVTKGGSPKTSAQVVACCYWLFLD